MMFAPYRRDHCAQWARNGFVGCLRRSVGCILGTIQSAPTEGARSLSWVSRRRKRSRACSLGRECIAQQTLDLQVSLQNAVRCTARMVSSDLTARICSRPWAGPVGAGLGASGMQGWRLVRRRVDYGLAMYILWTFQGHAGDEGTPMAPNEARRRRQVPARRQAGSFVVLIRR